MEGKGGDLVLLGTGKLEGLVAAALSAILCVEGREKRGISESRAFERVFGLVPNLVGDAERLNKEKKYLTEVEA